MEEAELARGAVGHGADDEDDRVVDHLVPEVKESVVGSALLEYRPDPPFVLSEMRDEDQEHGGASRDLKRSGLKPHLPQVPPQEHGIDDRMDGAMDQEPPDIAPFPGRNIVGLQSKVRNEMPQR